MRALFGLPLWSAALLLSAPAFADGVYAGKVKNVPSANGSGGYFFCPGETDVKITIAGTSVLVEDSGGGRLTGTLDGQHFTASGAVGAGIAARTNTVMGDVDGDTIRNGTFDSRKSGGSCGGPIQAVKQ